MMNDIPEITCPKCNTGYRYEEFLQVKNPDEWLKHRPLCSDGKRYSLCFDCWESDKHQSEDSIKVRIKDIPEAYKDFINENDLGVVLVSLGAAEEKTYVVESYKNVDNGEVIQWVAELEPANIEIIS